MSTGSGYLQERQRKLSEADLVLIEKYGSGLQFAETFNPDMQRICAKNIERSFLGDAPTINALCSAYTERQIRVWIIAQIESINQYTGVKDKMEFEQMKMLAEVIITEFGYLKASELLLFFFQFKAGKYGQLYGSVDPLKISNAIVEFVSYRKEKLFILKSYKERDNRIKEDLEWEQKWGQRTRTTSSACARSTTTE